VSDPRARPLRRSDLDPDPLRQLDAWLEQARAAGDQFPEAVALATASPEGRPSVRMVLLKGIGKRGLTFHSGYRSRKGRELEGNPQAALCFYWHGLGRQARVEGRVERTSAEDSDVYFATRPAGARLSAAASRQSEVVGSREELEAAVEALRRVHPDGSVPRPADWGGYLLVPDEYEFWQHREDRLHDRLRYRPAGDAWVVERLAP
jgi:pyridoxamine 5'-phosphate oxidase